MKRSADLLRLLKRGVEGSADLLSARKRGVKSGRREEDGKKEG